MNHSHAMSAQDIQSLQPSEALKRIPISTLARHGTATLREMLDKQAPVAIEVQGLASMVAMPLSHYDLLLSLISRLTSQKDDDFHQSLSARFDALVASMDEPGVSEATHGALFGAPERLNAAYRPGKTETRD